MINAYSKATKHPTATKWRPSPQATNWRHDVAMGVSPWNRVPHRIASPDGTTGASAHTTHVALSGLVDLVDSPIHGLAPVATACRPFGTNVLTPGRYVGAEAMADDGVQFKSKPKRGLTRELATQIDESEKLQAAIHHMQNLVFALPEVGE